MVIVSIHIQTTVVIVTVESDNCLQWQFMQSPTGLSYSENDEDKVTVCYSDTFASPRGCHCNRSILYGIDWSCNFLGLFTFKHCCLWGRVENREGFLWDECISYCTWQTLSSLDRVGQLQQEGGCKVWRLSCLGKKMTGITVVGDNRDSG